MAFLKVFQRKVRKLISIHLYWNKINLSYYIVVPSLDEIIIISLIDNHNNDELVDIEKGKKDYDNVNVVEINENIEEVCSSGNSSKKSFYSNFYVCYSIV